MAGNILAKERAIITLTTTGGSTTTGTATAAGTDLDARAAGNSADDFLCRFLFICQWATITSIVKDTIAAELYLLPKIDGTNLPTLDTTSGAGVLPYAGLKHAFPCVKAPTANTDMIFMSPIIDLFPELYTAYIINKSGQTISANWTLKVVSAQAQYT